MNAEYETTFYSWPQEPRVPEKGGPPETGHKPGKGTYVCTRCAQFVYLADDRQRLPPCPHCGHTEFYP